MDDVSKVQPSALRPIGGLPPLADRTIEWWIHQARMANHHDPMTAYEFYRAAGTDNTFAQWEPPKAVSAFLALDGVLRQKIFATLPWPGTVDMWIDLGMLKADVDVNNN